MIDTQYLQKVSEWIDSGDLAFDFEHGDEEKRFAILDFLEQLMDLGEKADEHATKLIFKKGLLEQLAGVPIKDDDK